MTYSSVYESNDVCGTADPAAYDATAQAAADKEFDEFFDDAAETLSGIHMYASRCPNYTLVTDEINKVHFKCAVVFGKLNLQWRSDQSDPQQRNALVQDSKALVAEASGYLVELGSVVQQLLPVVCEPCIRLFWKLCRTVSYMASAVFDLVNDGLKRCEPSTAWPGKETGAIWDAISEMLHTSVAHFNATVPAVSCNP